MQIKCAYCDHKCCDYCNKFVALMLAIVQVCVVFPLVGGC